MPAFHPDVSVLAIEQGSVSVHGSVALLMIVQTRPPSAILNVRTVGGVQD